MADVIPVKRYSTGLAELQSGDTINWSWLSGIPEYATRWPAWGEVTGKPSFATVATSGSYNDLSDKPTLGTAAAADTGDFDAAGAATSAVSAHVSASDPHPQYALETDLADVATSGAYADLTGTPTLGTAASADAGDFATAAQGALADSAVQPGDLAAVATSGSATDLTTGTLDSARLPATIAANTTGSAAKLTTARTLTIGSTGKTFDGSANVAWTLSEIGALAASAVGAASGVAPLGTDTKVPASYLPSYVDDVLEYSSLSAFPTTGETGKIYVADNTGKIYRWSGSTYIEISPSPGSTDAVPEGATNLYFTTARAVAAAPVQSVNGKTGVVSLTYTDVGAAPSSHVGAGGSAHAVATTSTAGFMSATDKTKLDGIATGATANTGTVTSVELSAPTGLSVSGSPITNSGTLALSWASGYQGYTTTEATKLAGIATGATVGADWSVNLSNIPANITSWASITPTSKADDSAVVKLAGNQDIPGQKRFLQTVSAIDGAAFQAVDPSSSSNVFQLRWSATYGPGFRLGYDGIGEPAFTLRGVGDKLRLSVDANGNTTTAGSIAPTASGGASCGRGSLLWSQVYATNSTINTSDARLKTEPRSLSDAEIAAFGQIGRLPCVWQWLERVAVEGDDARLHSGPTVQAAMVIMEANGLDWSRYSAFCYDTWEASRGDLLADGEQWDGETETAEEADTDPETGETITVTRTYKVNPAGDRYSFRKEELLWWCMRALFAEHDALAARVAALETA